MSDIPDKYLEENAYDAGAAFFSGFCYLLDDESVLSFFDQMDQMIRPGGFLYFEFWNSLAMKPNSFYKFEIEKEGLHLLRTNSSEYDVNTGIVTQPMNYLVWKDETIIDKFVEIHKLRTYTIPHLKSLINQSNWQLREIFSGFYNNGIDERKPKINDFRYYAILTH